MRQQAKNCRSILPDALFILFLNMVDGGFDSLRDAIPAQGDHDFINTGADGFTGQGHPQRLRNNFEFDAVGLDEVF